jgi:hypothetical protein
VSSKIDLQLSELIGRTRMTDKKLSQMLRELRDDVNELRDTINALDEVPGPGRRADWVMVDRRRLQWLTTMVDRQLNTITAKYRAPDPRIAKMFQDVAQDLREVNDALNRGEAVAVGPPAPMVPAPLPPPSYTQPAPPPPPPPQPTYIAPPPPPGQGSVYAINDATLRNLIAAIDRESFANDRMRVLGQAVPTAYFTVAQTQQLLGRFDFPRDRLEAMRMLKPRVLDTNNFFQLYASFDFASDKAELKRILGQ